MNNIHLNFLFTPTRLNITLKLTIFFKSFSMIHTVPSFQKAT